MAKMGILTHLSKVHVFLNESLKCTKINIVGRRKRLFIQTKIDFM